MAQLSEDAKKKQKAYDDKCEKILSTFSHEAQMLIAASRCQIGTAQKNVDEVNELYRKSGCEKPSDFLKTVCPEIYEKWIRSEFCEDFFWCIDNVVKWQIYYPFSNLSGRDSDYSKYIYNIIKIIEQFHEFSIFENSINDIIMLNNFNDIDEELYCSYEFFIYGMVSRLCHDDKDIEKLIGDVLNGEGKYYAPVSVAAKAIFMSDNKNLVQQVAKFILTAGIEEGARLFSSFEADKGTEENFLFMLRFCIENHMLRFPSVKIIACRWIHIKEITRSMKAPASYSAYMALQQKIQQIYSLVNEELLTVLYQSATDCQMNQKYIQSESLIEIYIALISTENHSYSKAYENAFELLKNGTELQKIAVYYFLLSADEIAQSNAGRYVFENYSDDFLLLSYYKDFYMANVHAHDAVFKVCINKNLEQYEIRKLSAAPKIPVAPEFKNIDEAQSHYNILMTIYNKMDKKKYEFKPVGFAQTDLSIGRSEILEKLCIIANMTDDNDKIEKVASKLSEITAQTTEAGYRTNRDVYLYLLLSRPKNQNQKKLLFSYIADKDRKTRDAAYALVKQYDKTDNDVLPVLEDMLRLKSSDIRNKALTLISEYPDNEQEAIISRLIGDKKAEKRACGLDILLRLSKDDERTELFNRCKKYLSAIDKPSGAERLVIDEINSKESSISDIDGYGIYNSDNISFPEFIFDENDRKKFCSIFTNSALMDEAKRIRDDGKSIQLLKELDNIFEENKNYEYTAYDGTAYLLGNQIMRTGNDKELIDEIPLSDVWKRFYSEKICSFETLVKMLIYLINDTKNKFTDKAYKLYGDEYRECVSLKYYGLVCRIIQIFLDSYYDAEVYGYITRTIFDYILNYLEADDRVNLSNFINTTCFDSTLYSKLIYPYILSCKESDEFKNFYCISVLADKVFKRDFPDCKISYLGVHSGRGLSIEDCIKAYTYKIINKDTLYYSICKTDSSDIESFSWKMREICKKMQDPSYKLNEKEKIIFDAYEKIIPKMVDEELRRGESETEFSQKISGIKYLSGVKTFVRILIGMENEKFQRGHHYHYNNEFVSKNESFSHLISICKPDKEETADDLRRELKGHKISQKRLIEASLYAPCEWIDIIGEYLDWKGYASCCFYFIAHMKGYSNKRTGAVIAKYTPLQENELNDGAFDIEWFRDAYTQIGEERFKIIYDASKYITDGSKHARARKFADAINGKLDPDKTKKEIEEKRNKDTLLAYTLIALKDENEAKERYIFLQQFLKESKKFGSLKRESEADAVSAAIGNLSRNAGYTDPTRFKLKMENLFIKDTSAYFHWHETDGVMVKISLGEQGKASVSVMKDEKPLKSIPASMKKNEHILELKELCTKITDQYRRTKAMFELSMEERQDYSAAELSELHHNPVAASVVDNLVFKLNDAIGFIRNGVLTDCNGSEIILNDNDMLVPAHSYDLWKSGRWHDYQKYVFDNKITQPFKQVFRELYVKTDEELEQTYTARYRGMQFRGKIASGCLSSRGWVYDYENAMQKVYYGGNIIAIVNAEPYWFIPFGTEDPSFEKVEFFDRKAGKMLKIKDVPDIIFSEIMRDIDLAVSVAYSGDTDPETSVSTIEIRKSVAEFTMKLFKISNVTFEKRHAFIKGKLAEYSLHLGSGIVHIIGGTQINIFPVKSYNRSKLFIPFEDDDNKTAEIISKLVLLSEDSKIKDPLIVMQITK